MSKFYTKNNYGVVPNKILQSKELTMKAKGLFAYLQSKPDGWDFSSERIIFETKDGVDAIQSGLRELESFGYLTRKKKKNNLGQWEWEYTLSDTATKNPELENPFMENPVLDNPAMENPPIKKEIVSKKEIVINSNNISKDKSLQDNAPRYKPEGAEIIEKLILVDKKNKLYYGNTTQRKACDFLIDEYGLKEVLNAIDIYLLARSKGLEYLPTITTPVQLRDKWTSLASILQKHQIKRQKMIIL